MLLTPITPPTFDVDLMILYATDQNVTGKALYTHGDCYLHKDAAARMQEAIRLATPLGLQFRLFDGFRPEEAQWKLWEHTPDPRFVADPRIGSLHTRGIAIDLTLIDRNTKQALDMGTDFDAFTPLSYHGVTEISHEAQRNRLLLLGVMTAAGFEWNPYEWWHYQLKTPENYPLLTDKEAGTRLIS